MRSRRPDDEASRLLLAAVIGLLVFLAAGILFAQGLPSGTKLEPRDALARSQAAIGSAIGDYALRDARGEAIRLSRYRGKPLLVSFVYTGCFDVCPVTTRVLGRAVEEAQRVLSTDAFRVITVGFNLPFDTPEAMRDFQKKQGIDLPNWEFLAASEAATIDALSRDVGFARVPTAGGFDHVTQVTIIDPQGRVFRQVYGESFELPMLVAPLRELVTGAPAPAQNFGGFLERVRILCTIYDPYAGKYRLNYGLFIEIFAGLSMLGGTAWYLTAEWRRQRPTRAS
jgi:protein SCO1/2